MTVMSLITALLLAGGTSTPSAAAPPQATAVGVAHARILAPAEVRRVGDRVEITTGDRRAPTQVHRTERHDGGTTADFY